ncbi:PREDICTED: mas-related G-protein coupled receptor member H-like [Chrysochloris asiatica]|uniref:Mas-related G-protein coupled receptor member H-like n=1 Tax=Chrysochloris asiatica TaxID=185453 RepID=A0A9B0WTS9_CHRAS|nr:PREDICTED: mas-related G-protein coupled receptor member H-like [Chrysochloris asiatica]
MTLNPLGSTLYTSNEPLDQANLSAKRTTQPPLDLNSLPIHIYISLFICVLGVSGNGLVIFLLFYIKRKPFTVYILHLAIADFMVLLGTLVLQLLIITDNYPQNDTQLNYIIYLVNFGYNTGLHLLTAISVERCLSVLYPIWYQCQRPKHQSAVTCTLLWALSLLVSGLENFICIFQNQPKFPECQYVYIFSCALTFVFVPLMVFSSVILFIKVGCNRKPRQPAKLYVIIMVTVVLFLVFAMPTKVLLIMGYYGHNYSVWYFFPYMNMLSIINSSVNPVVYFVVGSIRKRKSKKSLKEVLQRVFEENPMPGMGRNSS